MNEKDQYGISGSWKETFWRFLSGSEVRLIERNDNGDPVFDLPKNETAINKMLKIFDLFTEDGVYYNPQTADVSRVLDSEEIFASGRLLFKTVNFFDLETLRSYDIDIGILPCPKYDEAQENYYAPSFGAEISVLLKTLPEERRENVGILLEALAFDTNSSLLPEYKEVLLKTKYARDNESETRSTARLMRSYNRSENNQKTRSQDRVFLNKLNNWSFHAKKLEFMGFFA